MNKTKILGGSFFVLSLALLVVYGTTVGCGIRPSPIPTPSVPAPLGGGLPMSGVGNFKVTGNHFEVLCRQAGNGILVEWEGNSVLWVADISGQTFYNFDIDFEPGTHLVELSCLNNSGQKEGTQKTGVVIN